MDRGGFHGERGFQQLFCLVSYIDVFSPVYIPIIVHKGADTGQRNSKYHVVGEGYLELNVFGVL